MRNNILFIILLFNICSFSIQAQDEITVKELESHLEYLASDDLKGRYPGTEGGLAAAKYINDQFREAGLTPLGENGFQHFEVTTSVSLGEDNYLSVNGVQAEVEEQYMPFSYSKSDKIDARVVFAGYGFEIDSDTLKWNDYQDVDVKGKWVMLLRGDPEPDNTQSNFLAHSGDRDKVLAARDKGAAGVLFVSGPNWDAKDQLVSLYYDRSGSNAGIVVLNVKRETADQVLQSSGKTIKQLETLLNTEKAPISFELDTEVSANVQVNHDRVRTQNVVGLIEGSDPELKNEYIIIGAHYDHLGMGGWGSNSRDPDTIAVHNGADDNASGVAGVIEIAERLAANQKDLKRSIVAIAFGAEEMGLLGSKYFVDNPLVDKDKIVAMANFDMIGRLNEEHVIMVGGSGTSVESEEIIKATGTDFELELRLSPEGYGPSDHAPFYASDIPVFFINTGVHEDYHTPIDDIEFINFEGQQLVSDYSYALVFALANREGSLTFQEAGSKQGGRRSMRFKVTLGIMPDFTATDVKGLGVGGVRKDGPAYNGGMEKGDVIVALDGKPVNDIYDYMNRLKKLEPGQTVPVDVIRNGEKKVLLVQL